MTPDEIREAQQEILQRFSPEALAVLRGATSRERLLLSFPAREMGCASNDVSCPPAVRIARFLSAQN